LKILLRGEAAKRKGTMLRRSTINYWGKGRRFDSGTEISPTGHKRVGWGGVLKELRKKYYESTREGKEVL